MCGKLSSPKVESYFFVLDTENLLDIPSSVYVPKKFSVPIEPKRSVIAWLV